MSAAPGDRLEAFVKQLGQLPSGASVVRYQGRRYGLTIKEARDRRQLWLYAEELGGTDRISFNLYRLSSGAVRLKPCEMPAEKVIDFVLEARGE